jgi:dienelactone hydrolase
MKTKLIALLLCAAVLSPLFGTEAAAAAPQYILEGVGGIADDMASSAVSSISPVDTAARWMRQIIGGRYAEAVAAHVPLHYELRNAIDANGGIEAVVSRIMIQTGRLLSVGTFTFLTMNGPVEIYQADLVAEAGLFHVLVPFFEGRMAGFQVVPWTEPAIVMPDGFTEAPVIIDAGEGYPLEGRLVTPDNGSAVPAVLMVQGSGVSDYDEIVGANRIFGQIARGLAERGIASLRFTKRTYLYPEIAAEKDFTVEDEYVNDVLAAARLLNEQPNVSSVFILGHSQGGMLTPMFLDAGADADGMILLASTPRSLTDILDDQQAMAVEYHTAAGNTENLKIMLESMATWKLEREALEKATPEEALEMGPVYSMNAYYLYDLLRYDHLGSIKAQRKPTLILQGTKDFQVKAEKNYTVYESELASEDYVQMRLYEGLNHIFIPSAAANLIESVEEYNIPAQIPGQVFDDITEWIGSVAE